MQRFTSAKRKEASGQVKLPDPGRLSPTDARFAQNMHSSFSGTGEKHTEDFHEAMRRELEEYLATLKESPEGEIGRSLS